MMKQKKQGHSCGQCGKSSGSSLVSYSIRRGTRGHSGHWQHNSGVAKEVATEKAASLEPNPKAEDGLVEQKDKNSGEGEVVKAQVKKRFACDLCAYSSNKSGNLKRHSEVIHQKLKKFS